MSLHRKGRGWEVRWRDHERRQRSRSFPRKREADDFEAEIKVRKRRGEHVDLEAARSTVGVVALQWLESKSGWAESTRARNAAVLRLHVLPRWQSARLGDVRHHDVQAWVNEMGSVGHAPTTVLKHLSVLSGIFTFAVKRDWIVKDPTVGVEAPRKVVARRRYLSVPQVETLARLSEDRQDIVYVLAYCGLRMGELAALRVRSLDHRRSRLTVEESVTEVNGVLVWSPPKDGERREVPVPSFLAARLQDAVRGRGQDALMFQSPQGQVLRVRNMRRAWFDAAVEAADVGTLTPHQLRHTAASIAISEGAGPLAVSRMLGHSRPSITLDVYADLFDSDLDDVASRVGSARDRYLASVERLVD